MQEFSLRSKSVYSMTAAGAARHPGCGCVANQGLKQYSCHELGCVTCDVILQ